MPLAIPNLRFTYILPDPGVRSLSTAYEAALAPLRYVDQQTNETTKLLQTQSVFELPCPWVTTLRSTSVVMDEATSSAIPDSSPRPVRTRTVTFRKFPRGTQAKYFKNRRRHSS